MSVCSSEDTIKMRGLTPSRCGSSVYSWARVRKTIDFKVKIKLSFGLFPNSQLDDRHYKTLKVLPS